MIRLEKLKSLKSDTFYKKSSLLLSSFLKGRICLDETYIHAILDRLKTEFSSEKNLIETIEKRIENESCLVLKDYIDSKIGRIDADYDFINDNGTLDKNLRKVKERYLLLDSIRSPYNLGSIIRSSESFMIKKIILLSPFCKIDHPRAIRASLNTSSIIDIEQFNDEKKCITYLKELNLEIFSLECGGKNLYQTPLPDKGICILGNEEFGIRKTLLDISSFVTTIPLYGSKGSISVSVATGILLSVWSSKVN